MGKPEGFEEREHHAGGWASVRALGSALLREHVPLEGARVLLKQNKPAGYASFRTQIAHARGHKTIGYIAKLNFLYVDPRHRGRGFGTDLACATGMVCAEVLHALLNAAPEKNEICLLMTADLFFPGSSAIAQSVRDAIEFAREMPDRNTEACLQLAGYSRRHFMSILLNARSNSTY